MIRNSGNKWVLFRVLNERNEFDDLKDKGNQEKET